jgi:hypothetical protein
MPTAQLSFTTLGGEVITAPKRGKHYVQQRGYAFHPGTGPAGETCATCQHIARFAKFRKCNKAKAIWTGGPRTDILARAPACKYWEKAAGPPAPLDPLRKAP